MCKKVLIAIAIVAGVFLALVFGGLVYLGTVSPETFVVHGHQMRSSQKRTVEELGLLEPGEKIKYFYSDGLINIKDGMYFATDKHLVLYSENWDDPKLIVPFSEITEMDVIYNESWIEDSYITVVLTNGDYWEFPVSSEKGRDRDFYKYLQERSGANTDTSPSDDLPIDVDALR